MTNDLVTRLREAAYLDLYGVHRDVEREAAARIEQLAEILRRAVVGYESAYCRDEVNFDWIEDAKDALGKKDDL